MSFERRARPVIQKRVSAGGIAFAIWFAFCVLLLLALTVFGVWAVYELVTWVTSK